VPSTLHVQNKFSADIYGHSNIEGIN